MYTIQLDVINEDSVQEVVQRIEEICRKGSVGGKCIFCRSVRPTFRTLRSRQQRWRFSVWSYGIAADARLRALVQHQHDGNAARDKKRSRAHSTSER